MFIRILILLILLIHPALGSVYSAQDDFLHPLLAEGQHLIEQGEYTEAEALLRSFQTSHPGNAETAFLLGFALARQEKWSLSRDQFERAVLLRPGYVSALIELAGIQYKLGSRDKAIDLLQTALDQGPENSYVSEFLANLLYLEDRKIEALNHWNTLGKPHIRNINYRTAVDIEAGLLHRLFPLNEGEVLRRKQILDIRWKQERFGLGPQFSWHINPKSNDEWDLEINLPPRSTLSPLKTMLLSNAARVPVYREAVIEYPLELRSGNRFKGIVRWDAPQKRFSGTAWFPFLLSKSDSLRSTFDWRDEAWEAGQSEIDFQYKATWVTSAYEHVLRGRKSLLFHAGYEHQLLGFNRVEHQINLEELPDSRHFLNLGLEWNQRIGFTVSDNVKLDWKAYYTNYVGLDGGTIRADQVFASSSLDWKLESPWTLELKASFGAGHSSQNLPLIHYFMLGVGQDNPLPLRAHSTIVDEHKGKNPLGRQFVLGNLELHRSLLRFRTLEIKGQIFMDIGTVYKMPFGDESNTWYRDIGGGLRFGALGNDLIEILFGYDLNKQSVNFWIGVPG